MKAAIENGRFPHLAPIGCVNTQIGGLKKIVSDADRAPLVKKAFELVASGAYNADGALRIVSGMGLLTRKGRKLTKQSFGWMLHNPVYNGWVVSGGHKAKGNHEPLVSDELFQAVQDRLNGNGTPHKKLSDEFPLRGLVRCSGCGRLLTAGWVKGRKERYPRYWCWTKGCGTVSIGRGAVEGEFVALLERMEPPTEFMTEELPEIAAREWQTRKERIAKDSEVLSKRLAEQRTLNQKAITAKLKGELAADDFETIKASVAEEMARIQEQITALDCERSTMEELLEQTKAQIIDFKAAWLSGSVNQRQEMAKALFPDGLVYSPKKRFFEPRNVTIFQMLQNWFADWKRNGRGDWI
jgi:hypothetical protein